MNLTTVRLALRGAGAAFDYFRKLDDEKQRDIYDAVVDAIKNDEVHGIEDLKDIDELEDLYGTARAHAGDVVRSSHDRLDRRRAAFAAAAPERRARLAELRAEAKNAPATVKADKKAKKKAKAGRAAAILAGLAAAGGAAWAVYTFLLKDRAGATAQPAEPRPASSTGTATLVYSTTTEDDRGAGPLGEEPAVRDEELLSSIDEQLSTLDTLDDDQRDATR
ncbi:hypothetical protein [uncultured Corynebacterium sp.]|uniref:hypothetical protein n=1 Tax=uncultured Corynebacterium sp. TaxID=159447 RepID=UPI0025944B81|nr:hypothetical protein [uncultured Corynebacterium sp.]